MRWWLLLVVPALVLAACGGGGSDRPNPQAIDGAVAPARDAAAATQDPAEQSDQPVEPDPDAPYNPDEVDLTRLVFWDRSQSIVGREIPPDQQRLLDALLASDSPAVDKYVIDLGVWENPYRLQIVDYLRARYDTVPFNSIYLFPEIFDLDPSDTDTEVYVRFKFALVGGRLPEMAAFIHPDLPRAIDAREVRWGGVIVDGIPPLEFPAQETAEEAAAWINDGDEVIGVEINGDVRAYPIRIIAWHEMVNDTVGGVPVSLAYCTLCGSAILYDGRVGSDVYRFGTSGMLYRSNKLMYDRTTRTLWNQFTGEPAWGPLVGSGVRLKALPVVYTTWGDWRAAHPESTVMSIDTGFRRDYGPGVAYADYNASPDTEFAVPIQDDRLPEKEEVYVLRLGAALGVYPIAVVAEQVLITHEVDGVPVVVVATADGMGARSYESGGVEFVAADPAAGTLTAADGSVWMLAEDGLHGPEGQLLARISGHNAFWFAIANQTPEAALYEG